MSVAIPPSGTRGVTMPRLPGPLMRLMSDTMFKIFRNRRFMGFRVLMLTTIGARTGQPRRSVLGYFTDPAEPDTWIIVASAAGAARHPAWYFNLAKHPDQVWIEVGKTKRKVRPVLLTGNERAAAWQRVVAEAPSYAGYETRTDRQIPVVRLQPAA
jgi:deazaflavin-dependent oxidoreductase (nitroreductase family)